MVEGITDAISKASKNPTDSENKEKPDSGKLPFFYNLLDMYDLAREIDGIEPKKHIWFARWYHGLWGTGKIDSHEWVCWNKPDFYSPRFYSWDLSSGLEQVEGRQIRNWNKFGEPLGEGKTIVNSKLPYEWDKFFFCLFPKFILFPWFHLLFSVIRYVIIFFRVLFVPIEIIVKGVFNKICYIPGVNYFCSILGWPWKYNFATKGSPDNYLKPGLGDMLKTLIYTTLPVFIFDEEGGYTYGKAGLGVIILAIMAISAVIIFVGGSSVTVAVIGFAMYCFKLIRALGDFSTDGKNGPA